MNQRKRSRPASVTLLAVGVLIFTGINLLRLILSLEQWNFLASVLPFSPLYLALTGLAWGLAGLWLTWGLWWGRPWAPRVTRVAALAYTLYFWLDRLLLSHQHANRIFAIGTTIVLLSLIFWLLSRSKVEAYFDRRVKVTGELYEH